MALIGTLHDFDPDTDSWSSWVERLEQYIEANDIPDTKKVAVFLTAVGARPYSTLKDLLSPDKPATKSFEELIAALTEHYQPKPCEIAERFRFYHRRQAPGEDLQGYVVSLRKLASSCAFGLYLPTALRDQFVMGLAEEPVQKRLLSERDLTLKSAVEIAQAMTLAARDARTLQTRPNQTSLPQEVFEVTPAPAARGGAGRFSRTQTQPQQTRCFRCGATSHDAQSCRFHDTICHNCGKKGHLVRVCRGPKNQRTSQRGRGRRSAYSLDAQDQENIDQEEEDMLANLNIYRIGNAQRGMEVKVQLDGATVTMDLDTGAAVSVMAHDQWKQLRSRRRLAPTKVRLQTYDGRILKPVGCASVAVRLGQKEETLRLYILPTGGPPLFGREWIRVLGMPAITLEPCHSLTSNEGSADPWVLDLQRRFAAVFDNDLGKAKGVSVRLQLKPNAIPRFCKSRSVPFALKAGVEAELKRLEEQDVISPVPRSEWASPIVPVRKKNGELRICGDFKMALNKQLAIDQYPLPRTEELFASLAGGQKFSKIDLKHAYLQLEVHPDSRHLLTINTHKGLYQYKRMVFGVASAPAIWQRTMEGILAGIPHTQCMLDDMLITGKTEEEHKRNVEMVLQRLLDHGLKANIGKCEFLRPRLEFCAHVVDKDGLHTAEDKVGALVRAPAPKDTTQLRSFLGLLNYYHRFLPNLAHVLFPLHRLLETRTPWNWSPECQAAFQETKRLILQSRVLVHYDLQKPVSVACDASPYGLGAVLSHIMPDGSERPVAFASRSLVPAERNYSQIDKEALAIVWAIKKFHLYLYGRDFTLITDHKPLLAIFNPQKGISSTTASRLQRYALFLGAYEYAIRYRPHGEHGNADAMSRLPIETRESPDTAGSKQLFQTSVLTTREIEEATRTDPILSSVLEFVQHGWPRTPMEGLGPFEQRRLELTSQAGCLLWGARVVIPTTLRRATLALLHEGHPGVVRMKQKARGHVWWPGLDTEIESHVSACRGCSQSRRQLPRGAVQPWEWPTVPWHRIHIDFAGPISGHTYLVVIDAHTKWPEVQRMGSTSAKATIAVLTKLFAVFGLPKELVSDNGPQFVAEEFKAFLLEHGIKHHRTAPYHPATNGQAERFVQTLKGALKTIREESTPADSLLQRFLMTYRNTPHATTGVSPAQLMFGRPLRTKLDLLKPSPQERVLRKQEQMVGKGPVRFYATGEDVWARNYRGTRDWEAATVLQPLGSRMYEVETEDGQCWRRHADQLRPAMPNRQARRAFGAATTVQRQIVSDSLDGPTETPAVTSQAEEPQLAEDNENVLPTQDPPAREEDTADVDAPPEVERGRPVRERRPPTRWEFPEKLRDYRKRRRRPEPVHEAVHEEEL